jgi:DUF1365 family protein
MIQPGLYTGAVMHRRLASPPHRFTYGSFWVAIDLDRLDATTSRLFSVERTNLFSFHARDHADGSCGPLRRKIEAISGGVDVSGRMVLLTMPRLIGFVFNPLSVYFCHDISGAPSAIAWEVSNTFGGRHTYFIVIEGADGGVVRQACPKQLHVSPFLDMQLGYRFRVDASDESVSIGIVDRAAEGVVLVAALTASRREMTDRALLALFLRTPLATLKIVAAIHWQALRLWLKGARFRRAPAGSERPISAHAASFHRAAANLNPTNAVSEAADNMLSFDNASISLAGHGYMPAGAARCIATNTTKTRAVNAREVQASALVNESAASAAQGTKNASTPELCPKIWVESAVSAAPTNGSPARAASGQRLAT